MERERTYNYNGIYKRIYPESQYQKIYGEPGTNRNDNY